MPIDEAAPRGWWTQVPGDLKDIPSRNGWNPGDQDLRLLLSRFDNDGEYGEAAAKLLATLVLTLPGTPVAAIDDDRDVATADPDSVSHYCQRMTALRKATPALVDGDYVPVETGHLDVFAYARTKEDVVVLVILNLSANEAPIGALGAEGSKLIGSHDGAPAVMRPLEARVLRMADHDRLASPACSIDEVDPAYMGLDR